MAKQVEVEIVFNPDTKKLEKVIAETIEATEKKEAQIKVSIEEVDLKKVEGPLKDLQEKFMTIANGGFKAGIKELENAFSQASKIREGGGDLFTSIAGGLEKIGPQGAIALEGMMAFAGGVLAAGVALVEFGKAAIASADAIQNQQRQIAALGVDFSTYRSELNGVVDMQQALNIQNIAIANGHRLNAVELASVTNKIRDWGIVTGDSQNASQLWTQALSGNIESARQLGVVVSDYATRQQVMNATIQQAQQKTGSVSTSIGEHFEGLKGRLNELWDAFTVFFGASISVTFAPIIAGFVGAVTAASSLVRLFKEGLDYLGLINFAQQQAAIDAQRAEAARQLELSERNRVANMMIEDRLKQSSFLTTQLELRAQTEGVSAAQELADLQRQELDIRNAINDLQNLTFTTERDRLQNYEKINGLNQRLIGIVRERNNQNTIQSQMERSTQANLIAQARQQAGLTTQHVRQRTVSDEINEAVALRNRLLRISQLLHHNLTREEERDLANAQSLINQKREERAQAAQAAAQQRAQNAEALIGLRIENEKRRAQGLSVDSSLHELDVRSMLEQTQRAVNNLDLEHVRNQGELARRLEIRATLIQRIQAYTEIEEARNQQQIRIRDQLLETQRQEVAQSERLAQKEKEKTNIISRGRQEEFALAVQAMDMQRQGLPLTEMETQLASRFNQLLAQRNTETNTMRSELEANLALLNAGNLSAEEENRLLERNIELRGQLASRQREDLQRNQQQTGLTSRLGQAVEGLSGSYRDFGDSMGGLATGAVQQFSSAFSNMIAGAIEGKASFGELMQEMVKTTLAGLSQQAAVQSLFQVATGLGKLAIGDMVGAGNAFASAAVFGTVAAIAGITSAAIPSTEKDSGSSGGGSRGSSVDGASSTSNQNQQSGPVVLNINMRPFSTEEDVQKAVAVSLYAFERRQGTRR